MRVAKISSFCVTAAGLIAAHSVCAAPQVKINDPKVNSTIAAPFTVKGDWACDAPATVKTLTLEFNPFGIPGMSCNPVTFGNNQTFSFACDFIGLQPANVTIWAELTCTDNLDTSTATPNVMISPSGPPAGGGIGIQPPPTPTP